MTKKIKFSRDEKVQIFLTFVLSYGMGILAVFTVTSRNIPAILLMVFLSFLTGNYVGNAFGFVKEQGMEEGK